MCVVSGDFSNNNSMAIDFSDAFTFEATPDSLNNAQHQATIGQIRQLISKLPNLAFLNKNKSQEKEVKAFKKPVETFRDSSYPTLAAVDEADEDEFGEFGGSEEVRSTVKVATQVSVTDETIPDLDDAFGDFGGFSSVVAQQEETEKDKAELGDVDVKTMSSTECAVGDNDEDFGDFGGFSSTAVQEEDETEFGDFDVQTATRKDHETFAQQPEEDPNNEEFDLNDNEEFGGFDDFNKRNNLTGSSEPKQPEKPSSSETIPQPDLDSLNFDDDDFGDFNSI